VWWWWWWWCIETETKRHIETRQKETERDTERASGAVKMEQLQQQGVLLWNLTGPMLECPVEKGCLVWVERYLRDCVCSPRDTVSLVLGLLSVVSWGVAEVPQIITNFFEKSTEGVSLLFLMTWVIG
jgi:hypothetical protein